MTTPTGFQAGLQPIPKACGATRPARMVDADWHCNLREGHLGHHEAYAEDGDTGDERLIARWGDGEELTEIEWYDGNELVMREVTA